MIKFKEFKVGDLFDIEPTKSYKDIRDEEIKSKNGNIPFVTTQNTNNGISGYSELVSNNKGNVITASDTTTDDAIFYQEKDFIGRSHVQNIIPKKDVPFNKNIALYIISCMKKSAKGLYDYGNKFNRERMKSTSLILPVTPDGSPDYVYMEDYIKGIQRQYIDNLIETNEAERNRLLSIVGLSLDDYNRVKGSIELCDATSYGEFKVGDLFDSHLGKQVDYSNVGKYKVVSGVTENNGVLGYTDSNNHAVYENCLTVSNRGEYCGTAYIQKEPFVLSNNVIALVPKSEITFSFLLFSATCINKLNYGGYSGYPTKAGILNDVIKLPTTLTGEVDYAYMEDYISKIKLIYIYNRELSVNIKVESLRRFLHFEDKNINLN